MTQGRIIITTSYILQRNVRSGETRTSIAHLAAQPRCTLVPHKLTSASCSKLHKSHTNTKRILAGFNYLTHDKPI